MVLRRAQSPGKPGPHKGSQHKAGLPVLYCQQTTCAYSLSMHPMFFRMPSSNDRIGETNMSKEVQMSIKMESELRDRFMAAAAATHRPAAQIVRELMRSYLAGQNEPNTETLAAINAVERGEATQHASTDALFRTLGI
jgi:predicted DNA-binding protein